MGGFPVFERLLRVLGSLPWAVFFGAHREVLTLPEDELPYSQPTSSGKIAALSRLARFFEFITGVSVDGVKLTVSDYLPSSVVTAVLAELPSDSEKFGMARSESKILQAREIRRSLGAAGLVRGNHETSVRRERSTRRSAHRLRLDDVR